MDGCNNRKVIKALSKATSYQAPEREACDKSYSKNQIYVCMRERRALKSVHVPPLHPLSLKRVQGPTATAQVCNTQNECTKSTGTCQQVCNYMVAVARAAWMGPTPRCIHSSGVMRSSLVKIWSLNCENAQLSTCGAGSAVIALSSFPTQITAFSFQLSEIMDGGIMGPTYE